jgi:phenylacetate-CoA ligase
VDTSVRADIVISTIKAFASSYDQIILVGENYFVKKVLEDGLDAALDWKKVKMHMILGEEILPENLRTYFSDILGINPEQPEHENIIGSSFGVSEFGLNVFYETKELIRIRRLLLNNQKLKEALIGKDLDNLPAILQYNPMRVYVEEFPTKDNLSQIVLTNLEENTNIPLIRYNIKDEGIGISFEHLKETLTAFGYTNYIPRIRLPLVAVWGRDKILLEEGFAVRPEFVEELLYLEKDIAANITGNFMLSNSKAGLRIEIQAKSNNPLPQSFENNLRDLLISNIPAKIEIIIYPYKEFPYGMELNFEKKFQHII